mgnify:CR=1 FL=1
MTIIPINQPNKPEYGTTLTEADYEQAVTLLQLAERDMRNKAWGSAHFTLLHAMLNLQIKPTEGEIGRAHV